MGSWFLCVAFVSYYTVKIVDEIWKISGGFIKVFEEQDYIICKWEYVDLFFYF